MVSELCVTVVSLFNSVFYLRQLDGGSVHVIAIEQHLIGPQLMLGIIPRKRVVDIYVAAFSSPAYSSNGVHGILLDIRHADTIDFGVTTEGHGHVAGRSHLVDVLSVIGNDTIIIATIHHLQVVGIGIRRPTTS